VTLLIALAGAAVGIAVMGLDAFRAGATLGGSAPADVFELWLSFLVSMNVLLLVFNLVPAYPLDGGRIAQAAVWRLTGDRNRATRVAALLGMVFAALLVGYGLYQLLTSSSTFGGLWYIALGWLLGSAARGATARTALTERFDGITVADVMDPEPVTIPAELPASRAWDEYFLRYQGSDWFPVAAADGRWVGTAHRAAVQQVAAGPQPAGPELLMRDIAAPAEPEGQIRSDAPLAALLASEPLGRLGALAAIDGDGRLRGVVTHDDVARAVRARLAPSA
jgi:CBS domain-containing protein